MVDRRKHIERNEVQKGINTGNAKSKLDNVIRLLNCLYFDFVDNVPTDKNIILAQINTIKTEVESVISEIETIENSLK